MKKLLLVAAIALLGFGVNAQVRLGFGTGYAIPLGDIADFTDGGITGSFELGYAVTEDIDVSIIAQGDFLAGGDVNGASVGAVAISSYLLNGRYYFSEDGFRPYGSLGLGLANVGSVDLEVAGTTVEGESSSGFALRPALGFKYGVLNMNLAYLNAGKSGDASVSDFSINIGLLFTIGNN
jgi:hypothetical protein